MVAAAGGGGGGASRSFSGLGFDPAPGDKAAVAQVLVSMVNVATQLAPCGERMSQALTVTDDWDGDAADDFHDVGDDLPQAFVSGAESLASGAKALTTWLSRLTANQDLAEELDREARRLRGRLESAREDLVSAERAWASSGTANADDALGEMVDAQEKVNNLETDLKAVLDRARRLEHKHLREARAAAEAVDAAADGDPFEAENDNWTVQVCDGVSSAAGALSAATGLAAAALAATGVLAPVGAALGTVSAASGGVSLLAGVGQRVTGSKNAPSNTELLIDMVPAGSVTRPARAVVDARAAAKTAGKGARDQARDSAKGAVDGLRQAARDSNLNGVSKLVREAREMRGVARSTGRGNWDAYEYARLRESYNGGPAARVGDGTVTNADRRAHLDAAREAQAREARWDMPDNLARGYKGIEDAGGNARDLVAPPEDTSGREVQRRLDPFDEFDAANRARR